MRRSCSAINSQPSAERSQHHAIQDTKTYTPHYSAHSTPACDSASADPARNSPATTVPRHRLLRPRSSQSPSRDLASPSARWRGRMSNPSRLSCIEGVVGRCVRVEVERGLMRRRKRRSRVVLVVVHLMTKILPQRRRRMRRYRWGNIVGSL